MTNALFTRTERRHLLSLKNDYQMSTAQEYSAVRIARDIRRKTGWNYFSFKINENLTVRAQNLEGPYDVFRLPANSNTKDISIFPFIYLANTNGKLLVDFPFTRTVAKTW